MIMQTLYNYIVTGLVIYTSEVVSGSLVSSGVMRLVVFMSVCSRIPTGLYLTCKIVHHSMHSLVSSLCLYMCVCVLLRCVPIYVPLNHVIAFIIKVWAAKQGDNFQLLIERTINLRRLMYIGNLVKICTFLLT